MLASVSIYAFLPLNLDDPYNSRNLTLEVGKTRVCTSVCSAVEMNDTFAVSLSRSTDLDPRVQLAANRSVAIVNDTRGRDGTL